MKSDVCKRVISESRKIRKPLMEKKRRARINDSLETLKQILLDSKTALKETTTNESGQQQNKTAKLEKADILEMTVRYVQQLRNKLVSSRSTSSVINIRKEQVAIRPADSSSEKVKITFVPTRLKTGEIVFVMPTTTLENCDVQQKEGCRAVPIAENVWRPW